MNEKKILMKKILDPETEFDMLTTQPEEARRWSETVLSLSLYLVIGLAFVTGAALLLDDLVPQLFANLLPHAPVSAAPLLLIGTASLGFQILLHPRPLDLFKGLLVSLAFLFWGIDQMLPAGWFTTTLGDIVIVLYVIDLGWLMAATVRSRPSKRN
jgi:hypothetical protein